uniref:Holin n=1 Tax=viral metagenome TaxID=1070528 RepID=A0A6H1ZTV2_9ZZZZ
MKFNNKFALVIAASIIPGLWIVNGTGLITLPGEIIGATIAAFTLIVQYYFRKKVGESSNGI